MGKNQYSYPREYRARMVELARAGRTPEELGREFEPTTERTYSCIVRRENTGSAILVVISMLPLSKRNISSLGIRTW